MLNLTAETLIPTILSLDGSVVLINFLVCAAGLLLHYIKKCSIEKINWKEYWTQHGKNSAASIGGVLFTFLYTQIAEPSAPLSLFFTIGFVCDSILNKAPRGSK